MGAVIYDPEGRGEGGRAFEKGKTINKGEREEVMDAPLASNALNKL